MDNVLCWSTHIHTVALFPKMDPHMYTEKRKLEGHTSSAPFQIVKTSDVVIIKALHFWTVYMYVQESLSTCAQPWIKKKLTSLYT